MKGAFDRFIEKVDEEIRLKSVELCDLSRQTVDGGKRMKRKGAEAKRKAAEAELKAAEAECSPRVCRIAGSITLAAALGLSEWAYTCVYVRRSIGRHCHQVNYNWASGYWYGILMEAREKLHQKRLWPWPWVVDFYDFVDLQELPENEDTG